MLEDVPGSVTSSRQGQEPLRAPQDMGDPSHHHRKSRGPSLCPCRSQTHKAGRTLPGADAEG